MTNAATATRQAIVVVNTPTSQRTLVRSIAGPGDGGSSKRASNTVKHVCVAWPETAAGEAQGAAHSGAYAQAQQQCQRPFWPQPEGLAAIWAHPLCRNPLAWGLPSGVACSARLSPNRASASRLSPC